MYCSKKNKWMAIIAVIAILYSNVSFAVGLGKIKVYSYLNELLTAEIELVGVENINTELMIAALASPKDFIRANMARPFFLTKLSFEIVRYEEQTVIYVTSTKPVKHPFLDFLVELSWPDGKLVKGYTILIDPLPQGGTPIEHKKSLFKKKAFIENETQYDVPETTVVPKEGLNQTIKSIAKPKPVILNKQATKNDISKSAKPLMSSTTTTKSLETVIEEPKIVSKEKQSKVSAPITNKIEIKKIDETLINDVDDVENALVDNIEINKQEKSTGLLQGIISIVKENPLVDHTGIDSSKLAEKPLATVNTEHKPSKMATLQDLLEPKNKQQTQIHNPANNNVAIQYDTDVMDNKPSTAENNQNITSKLKQQEVNIITVPKQQDSEILYKKYSIQLILSFLMVIISGFFIVKLLKRSHDSEIIDKKVISSNMQDFTNINNGSHSLDLDDCDTDLDDFEATDFDLDKMELSEHEFNGSLVGEEENVDIPVADELLEPLDFQTYNKKEVDLKINLATQYIAAGDSNSAKSILNEIIGIADLEQKHQIENLLKGLVINRV